jgi:catechol 2,3-dioxygenase-like lactoylglutathione lyase family enzyme
MIPTFGLTHISLSVRNPQKSFKFYQKVFGVREIYRDEASIQVQTPGTKDVIAFEKDSSNAGQTGGIAHFGFRLLKAADIDTAVREVKKAGGKILRRGEFSPGFPFVYFLDPDGYEIEIWYE